MGQAGLVLLTQLLRLEAKHEESCHLHPATLRGWGALPFAVLALVGTHGVEIWR
jgi:hypothetical protein